MSVTPDNSGSPPTKRASTKPAAPAPPQNKSAPAKIDDSDAIIELDWTDEVEKIDEAIKDLQDINQPDKKKTPAPEILPRSTKPPQENLLSGFAEAGFAPNSSRAIALKCRVRPKSESELGQLWGNIFFAVEQSPPKIIIVMGAQRGEGATQIAVGLAMIGAEADRELKVALVDFNVRNPQIADLLRLKHQPGLTDVLNGQTTLESAMQVVGLCNGNKLHVLTGGAVCGHPLGLLKSRQARSLIAELRQRFDHVILDVANAKAYPDPQVLGSLVDGAVMVVKAADTPRETASQAKKRLDTAGVRCLGVVLNQRSDPIPSLLYQMT